MVAPGRRAPVADEPAARHRRGHLGRQGDPLRRGSAAAARGAGARSRCSIRSRAGSSRTPRTSSTPSSRRSPRCCEDAPGEVVACGLDHQGESVLAWDAETGRAAHAGRDVAGQALAGGPRPARGRRARPSGSRSCSGMPLDPYFSAGKLAWLLEHDEAVAARARRRHAAAGHGRLVPLRPARRRASRTDPSTASRTQLGAPDWDAALLEIFGVPREVLPAIADTAGDLGTLRHPSWPVELPLRARCADQQAALAGAGCVEPGRTKATYGTGVFVLANVGDERPGRGRRPRSRPSPGASTARSSGRSTAASSRPARCSSGSSRDLGLAPDPPALAAPRRRGRGRRRRARAAGARRDSARRGGGPTRAAVFAGADGRRAARRTSPARRSRRSRGGWRTWSR